MNTFNFFLSALCLATATADPTKVLIKDNVNHVITLGKCDTNANVTVTLIGTQKDKLPYLFPKKTSEDNTSTFSVKSDLSEKLKNFTAESSFPGHFQIQAEKIKVLEIKSTGKKDDFQVYLSPPDVKPSKDNNLTETVKLNVTFTCDGTTIKDLVTDYEFVVSNSAQTITLVSSAAVVAASLFFVL